MAELETTKDLKECPHCGNKARTPIIVSETYREYWPDAEGEYTDWHWKILFCESCKRPSVTQYEVNSLAIDYPSYPDEPIDFNPHITVLYPSQPDLSYLPDIVLNTYKKALKLFSIDPSAFAVGIRKTLEQLCKDQEADGKTLHQRLENLRDKQKIPATLVEIALNMKTVGNAGAHASDIEIDNRDAELLVFDQWSPTPLIGLLGSHFESGEYRRL